MVDDFIDDGSDDVKDDLILIVSFDQEQKYLVNKEQMVVQVNFLAGQEMFQI